MFNESALVSKTLLRFFNFKDLPNWSTYSIFSKSIGFGRSYKFVPISEILKRVRREIIVKDETEYKRVTIKLFGKGVKIRDTAFGKDIGTKRQFIAQTGDFLLSKIDARNGAFGLADETIDGAIITNDFPAYSINEEKALSNYFELITHTQAFLEFCRSASSGSTGRQRVDEQDLLACRIPLPPKDVQRKLVDAYQSAMTEAAEATRRAAKIEQDIENYLLDELGIEITNNEIKKGLQFVAFKELERWDIWNAKGKGESNTYKNASLADVIIGSPQYGANVRAVDKISDCRYIRITDINESGELNNNFVSAEQVEEKYVLKPNDLLIARSGATVGKTFLYDKKYGKAIFAGYLVRYVLNTNKVIPEYFLYFSKSKIYKNWILSQQRISAQPNINGQEFLKSPLVLPSLLIQEKIVGEINARREEIKSLRETAKAKQAQAKADFENALFEI